MKINNENKAKFFVQYWGQKVLSNDFRIANKIGNLKVKGREITLHSHFLELKSLSDISDEDAVGVYNILYPETKWADDYKIKEVKSWLNNEFGISNIFHKWDVGHIFDFLRDRGYLVPFLGLSCEELIESGWTKYRKEVQND